MAKTGGGLRNTRPANSTGSNQVTEQEYSIAAQESIYEAPDYKGKSDYNNATINAYTRVGYRINNKIVKGITLNDSDKQYIKNLEKSLKSLPNENPNLTLYRGKSMSLEQTSKYQEGNTIQLNTFLSTTAEETFATNWARTSSEKPFQVIYKIISHKSAKNIEKISNFPSERERLFNIGTKFRVLKRDLNSNGYILTITLKEV